MERIFFAFPPAQEKIYIRNPPALLTISSVIRTLPIAILWKRRIDKKARAVGGNDRMMEENDRSNLSTLATPESLLEARKFGPRIGRRDAISS
jgi:hypothetical protein